jgi:CO/xanthine dehydrogenase Mo-binding subunit
MGDVDAGLAQAAQTVSATYRTSYLAHGALGPHVAVADVTPTGVTIIHQIAGGGVYASSADVATVLGLPVASVREIAYQGSSFYGGVSTDHDAPSAAALMSKAVGKPVRVQFMRWDEHGYDNYDAAEVIDVRRLPGLPAVPI